jgi:hypothetical protein
MSRPSVSSHATSIPSIDVPLMVPITDRGPLADITGLA